jgi:hypothetical protein
MMQDFGRDMSDEERQKPITQQYREYWAWWLQLFEDYKKAANAVMSER